MVRQIYPRVALAAGVLNVSADRVKFNSQILDVGIRQMCERWNVGNRHRFSLLFWPQNLR
jgi:hypothetical protein